MMVAIASISLKQDLRMSDRFELLLSVIKRSSILSNFCEFTHSTYLNLLIAQLAPALMETKEFAR
jgi:hypothetical protein